MNLGAVIANRGDIDTAIVHFQKAIELDPKNAKALKHLERAQLDLE